VLAQWVSSTLKKALTESNIKSGFRAIGIWPLNIQAINQYMQPSIQFIQPDVANSHDEHSTDNEERDSNMHKEKHGNFDHTQGSSMQGQICDSEPNQPRKGQYFIGTFEPQLQSLSRGNEPGSNDADQIENCGNMSQPTIHSFLQLPEMVLQRRERRTHDEPLVDYSKSIMLTSKQYLQSMELKAERKEKARR
jgi:hypothetical protein